MSYCLISTESPGLDILTITGRASIPIVNSRLFISMDRGIANVFFDLRGYVERHFIVIYILAT